MPASSTDPVVIGAHVAGPRSSTGGVTAVLDSAFLERATAGCWTRAPQAVRPLLGVGTDSRDDLSGQLFVALRGPRHDGHDHLAEAADRGAAVLMVDREIDQGTIAEGAAILKVADTVAALQRLAAAWRGAVGCVVVAITGSAGKTTTRRLVHAALAEALPAVQSPKSFNNHLGVPLTLLSVKSWHRVAVVEIGMNAPGEIAALSELAAPEIGVVTSVGRAHLEGVGSLAGVAREKSDLLRRVRTGACAARAVATADSPALRPYLHGVPGLVLVGESPESHVRLVGRRVPDRRGPLAPRFGQEIEVATSDGSRPILRAALRLPGKHNALNALAAIAVARHLGVADEAIVRGLSTVEPEAMRFQPAALGGSAGDPPVLVVNDAYNANPESMVAALETFAETFASASRRLLVLGDMLELGESAKALHEELGERLVELHRRLPIDRLLLVGPSMGWTHRRMLEGLVGALGAGIEHAQTLGPEVISGLAAEVRPGDAVLIKGSRSMGLERVAAALEARFGSASSDGSGGAAAD